MAVTYDPCYSDYESDDESDYGPSNSEIDTEDFENKFYKFYTAFFPQIMYCCMFEVC